MIEINCPSCLSSNILEDRQVARDINCITCGATFFVEKISADEEPELADKSAVGPDDDTESNVVICTGTPPWDYDIIDTIFVLDTLDKKFFSTSSPSVAFKGAKAQLRARAEAKGGDAVIDCRFDYRVSAGHGIFGVIHDLEIFAYGTMVKRK